MLKVYAIEIPSVCRLVRGRNHQARYTHQFASLGDVADQYAVEDWNVVKFLFPNDGSQAVVPGDKIAFDPAFGQDLIAVTKNGSMRLQKSFHRSVTIKLLSDARATEGDYELGIRVGKKSTRARNTSRGSRPSIERGP